MVRRAARDRPGRSAPGRTDLRLRGRLLAALAVAVALGVPAGCAGTATRDEPADQPGAQGLPLAATARLDAAVAAVDSTRSAMLALPAAVVTAAMALDTADEACATGVVAAAQDARRPVAASVPGARAALAGVPARTRAHRAALQELMRAAAPLAPEQRAAVEQVVAGGGTEATAVDAFAGDVRSTWPAYAALDQAQRTWLERASKGWYRTPAEAAGGYAVLVRPQGTALAAARTALGRADAGRREVSERQRAALSAADRALEDLRAPA